VAGLGADIHRAVAHPGAGGHQGPEAGTVLLAGSVVQVWQTQVVAELVGEDTHATVLGLDGILADPVVAVPDLAAAQQVEGGPAIPCKLEKAYQLWLQIAFGTQNSTASLLAFTGVHRLEGVNVAIRLVELPSPS